MLVSVISAELSIVPNFNISHHYKHNMSMIEITTNDNQILIHKMARMVLEIHIKLKKCYYPPQHYYIIVLM